MYVAFCIVFTVSFVLGIGAGIIYSRHVKPAPLKAKSEDPMLLTSRIVECIAGLIYVGNMTPAAALHTTAIRLRVYGNVPEEVSHFLFTLANEWNDELAPDSITIRPEEVQIVLTHAASLANAEAAILELCNNRRK